MPFVNWPKSILEDKHFRQRMQEFLGEDPQEESTPASNAPGFREKFEAKHRSSDGHFVRSKAEMLIDNWLYMAEIVHAYERKLPVEEDVYSDFYIPAGRVYIEYWGLEDDPKYQARKAQKQDIYRKYALHLIELDESCIQNLDDILPAKLLKFGVRSI